MGDSEFLDFQWTGVKSVNYNGEKVAYLQVNYPVEAEQVLEENISYKVASEQ